MTASQAPAKEDARARKVLLHICCAPCLGGPLKQLREEGFEVEGFFFNPNIHPLIEFRRRLKALKVFCESDLLKVTYREEYGLETFLRETTPSGWRAPDRCRVCYRMRLTETARRAKESGGAGFTSTLFASHQQNHEMIREIAQDVASKEGVELVYRDMRGMAPYSDEVARKRQLYRQIYCGCIFSEYDRYRDTTKHLYGASDGPPESRPHRRDAAGGSDEQ